MHSSVLNGVSSPSISTTVSLICHVRSANDDGSVHSMDLPKVHAILSTTINTNAIPSISGPAHYNVPKRKKKLVTQNMKKQNTDEKELISKMIFDWYYDEDKNKRYVPNIFQFQGNGKCWYLS